MVEEINIKSLGNFENSEYGIDQHKNVYSRLPGKVSWECIFEYRHVPKTRQGSASDMRLIAEIGLFSFAEDSEGNYWKKMKNQMWTEFTNGIEPPKYYMQKIIATKGNNYWVQERKNKTIIKHTIDTSNQHHINRTKEYYELICCERKQRRTQIEHQNDEKAYIKRKKAKLELYNEYFVLK